MNPPHAPATATTAFLAALILWSLVWKGIAMWKAARRDQPLWYIALLIVNTAGILDLIYILVFAPRQRDLVAEAPDEGL